MASDGLNVVWRDIVVWKSRHVGGATTRLRYSLRSLSLICAKIKCSDRVIRRRHSTLAIGWVGSSVTRLGDFWKLLATNLNNKSSQNIRDFSGLFWKHHFLNIKSSVTTFLSNFRKFGQIFIPRSGHTGSRKKVARTEAPIDGNWEFLSKLCEILFHDQASRKCRSQPPLPGAEHEHEFFTTIWDYNVAGITLGEGS